MPFRAVTLCKPCLNKKRPLRKQLLLSFLTLAAVSLLLAVKVVLGTTAVIGETAKSKARKSLEDQITRHLTNASVEAAATIGERFRKLQYGVLDVSAFALRDALQEDLNLDGGGEGYPLTPAHIDLRDTEITASTEATLVDFDRQDYPVDLSRSTWYYADSESFTVAVPADEQSTINQSARLDLLWPTMYINSNDTKAIFVGMEFTASTRVFRQFPGGELSGIADSAYKCEAVDASGSPAPCYNPTVRPWYTKATAAKMDQNTQLREAVVTDPYAGAAENDWLVTLARAVYSDSGSTVGNLLGVIGVDVKLEQVQNSVEEINFLTTGYSILATADEGIVLAGRVWGTADDGATATVCELGIGICSSNDGDGWRDLLADTQNGGVKTFTSLSTNNSNGDTEDSILVAAPVKATFDTTASGGEGNVTHYFLSIVPKSEIFEPVDTMMKLIHKSFMQIIFTTAIVAGCTLLAVAAAVYFLSGSITRPIVKMTAAARSIAEDGAKHDVFGSVADSWGRGGQAGGRIDRTKALDYLLCRGDDEISTLAKEFSDMITGLGRRGSAAGTKSLTGGSGYPDNPFTVKFVRPPPTAPFSSITEEY